MVKNSLWVSNPFSPFFNELFPNPYVRISFEREYIEILRHFGNLKSRWEIPWEAIVRGGSLGGLLGPGFLLLPVSLLGLRQPRGRRLLLAAAVFALPYLANIGTRFLIPSVPFASLAMGMRLAGFRGAAGVLALAQALACWPAILERYCDPYAWRLRGFPVRAALRREPEASYLSARLPGYEVARMVEELVPSGGRVFTFGGIPQAYTSRDILVAYQSAFNNTVNEILMAPMDADTQPTPFLCFSFPAEPLRKVRVVQTAREGQDLWSVTELWVLKGQRELPRDPRWRLRAAAVEEIRLRGIDYLLVSDSDYGAEDFRRNAATWGLTPLGETSGSRLYAPGVPPSSSR